MRPEGACACLPSETFSKTKFLHIVVKVTVLLETERSIPFHSQWCCLSRQRRGEEINEFPGYALGRERKVSAEGTKKVVQDVIRDIEDILNLIKKN